MAGGMILSILFVATNIAFLGVSSAEMMPKSLLGTWRVSGVSLDTTMTRTPYYNFNDRSLLGRKVRISADMADGNFPEKTVCIRPISRSDVTSLNSLLDSTMGKQENEEHVEAAERYQLHSDGNKKVKVVWIGCKKGDFGPDTPFGPVGYNWVAILSESRIAMRWYDNTVLLLKREK